MISNSEVKQQIYCSQTLETIIKDEKCENLHIADRISLSKLVDINRRLKNRIEC